MIFTSIFTRIAKINKTPKSNLLDNLFVSRSILSQALPFSSVSSSSPKDDDGDFEIPAKLRQKDWLVPRQVQVVFSLIENPNAIVPSLNQYSKRKDYKPNAELFSLIINQLAEARRLDDIKAVFHRATSENQCRLSDDFFRCAIVGFGAEKAAEIIFNMPRKYRCWPSTQTFNSALESLVSAGNFRAAFKVFVSAPKLGVGVDSESLNVMVKCLCLSGKLESALQVLDEFPQLNCRPNLVTFTTLARFLCAEGRVRKAFVLVERMEKEEGIEAETVIYNAMIGGLVSRGKIGEAVKVFDWMKLEGCEPDNETYREMLLGLFAAERFSKAVELAKRANETGICLSFEVYEGLFRAMSCENRINDVCWALKEMIRQELVPDSEMWRVILKILFHGNINHFCANDLDKILAP